MEVIPQSIHWLLPEEASPCDIFLHFRGQNALILSQGRPISFALLEKLAKAECPHIYVKAQDLPTWQKWASTRHSILPTNAAKAESDEAESDLYGNKRAELLSYVQKAILKKDEKDNDLEKAFEKALQLLTRIIKQPILDWYFQQFHEPPDLLHHNGRVAFSLAAFCQFHLLAPETELEPLIFSCLIHELEGRPEENLKTVVSQRTLAILEKAKHPVPKAVIQFIRLHDELCSGKGFPNNLPKEKLPKSVRAFSLLNHFEHYRLQASGTRRARFDRAKQQMSARKTDFDSELWNSFWDFLEKKIEVIS